MNDDFIAVGIFDHRHAAAWTFKRLGLERNMSIFQALDRLLEIFHFERDTRSLVRGFPLIGKIRKREGLVTDRILDPMSLAHFLSQFQSEHAFVKLTRA